MQEATYPPGFRRLHHYIYPYLNPKTANKVRPRSKQSSGSSQPDAPSSPAGGGQGGNPSLWDVHAEVNVTLTNTGNRIGKEVVQLYVSFPTDVPINTTQGDESTTTAKVDFPVRVLRNFEKVELKPEESKSVSFRLTRKDLSFWSTTGQTWVMPIRGKFKVQVGTSSRRLPLVAEL